MEDIRAANGHHPADSRIIKVFDKYTGEVIDTVVASDETHVRRAVETAKETFSRGSLEPYRRYEILMKAAALLNERQSEFVPLMVAESGFTLNDCKTEFARTQQTLMISAEEAKRITGELVPIQGAPGQHADRLAFTIRMPIGVVCAITPFNSPLNTVAHKIAPALAAGNSVVLKPSIYTPLTAAKLVQVLYDAGLPLGWLNIVHGEGHDVGQWLLDNQDIEYYTFTGSTRVGRIIQSHAGLRRTQLELGSISSTIVCEDASLAAAADKCVAAAFRKAGQVCTSVQRILVHESVIDDFADMLAERANKLVIGDPRNPDTFVGPMIDKKEAIRALEWVDEAVKAGARKIIGGRREGGLLWPIILRNVSSEMRVVCEEIFAPALSLVPFKSEQEALAIANDTAFGLAVGIFTTDITRALRVIRKLRMGSIHINDTSSSRVDLMPYGGVKASGFGHEGPRYAIRDMTEERFVTLNPL
jgi:acyl-CoA reductase-like NAD-dependent aldehyde dehydrogenase